MTGWCEAARSVHLRASPAARGEKLGVGGVLIRPRVHLVCQGRPKSSKLSDVTTFCHTICQQMKRHRGLEDAAGNDAAEIIFCEKAHAARRRGVETTGDGGAGGGFYPIWGGGLSLY